MKMQCIGPVVADCPMARAGYGPPPTPIACLSPRFLIVPFAYITLNYLSHHTLQVSSLAPAVLHNASAQDPHLLSSTAGCLLGYVKGILSLGPSPKYLRTDGAPIKNTGPREAMQQE